MSVTQAQLIKGLVTRISICYNKAYFTKIRKLQLNNKNYTTNYLAFSF